jgi:hypothetical protein
VEDMDHQRFRFSSLIHFGQTLYESSARPESIVHKVGVVEPSVDQDGDGKPEHEYPAHNVAGDIHVVALAMRDGSTMSFVAGGPASVRIHYVLLTTELCPGAIVVSALRALHEKPLRAVVSNKGRSVASRPIGCKTCPVCPQYCR